MRPRQRLVTWEDPLPLAALGAARSGLDLMKAVAAGELPPPPIARLLGMTMAEIEEGRAVFALDPEESHYNPIGLVHGGVAATLLDSAMGCAVQTTLPAGTGYTTLELKVNFVRAVTLATGTVHAEGTVVHRGRTVCTAEARLTAVADGSLLAHGTSTLLLMEGAASARAAA